MDAGIMSGTYPGICRANVYVHTNAICRLLCELAQGSNSRSKLAMTGAAAAVPR